MIKDDLYHQVKAFKGDRSFTDVFTEAFRHFQGTGLKQELKTRALNLAVFVQPLWGNQYSDAVMILSDIMRVSYDLPQKDKEIIGDQIRETLQEIQERTRNRYRIHEEGRISSDEARAMGIDL